MTEKYIQLKTMSEVQDYIVSHASDFEPDSMVNIRIYTNEKDVMTDIEVSLIGLFTE